MRECYGLNRKVQSYLVVALILNMEEHGFCSDCEMQFVFSCCSCQNSQSEMEELEQPVVYTSASSLSDPSSWANSELDLNSDAVENFRRKLKYYFMNPCEKFRARGRKPWKLMLQILKIAFITIQLVTFGLSNQMVVTFKEENLIAFKHLFLKGYNDQSSGTYAVYTQTDVYEHLYFIIDQYVDLHNITVGNHAYEKNGGSYTPLSICQEFFQNGSILPGKETFDIDAHIETECIEIYPLQTPAEARLDATRLNFTLHFKRLLSVDIDFTLKAINLQTVRHHELPDCYDFTITITFNNRVHSGRIQITLEDEVDIKECKDWNITGASARNIYYILFFDSLIIVICLTSLILCTRSVFSGIQLQFEYTAFFKACHDKNVTWSERMEFVNGWYILIIISDSLTIVGSILKIEIQTKNVTSYDVCSILLGTATMLVWVGVIRYLGFFKKYNILILTLRAAFPNVIRFCCCVAMIYLGYCFCGWVVLGPYHEKFRTINTVSECLFSLINGDDMFPTFKNMQQKSYLVWLFSRLYLYSFVSLFIYMVLSLFITLITDTYETIKQHQRDGFIETDLQAFIAECKDPPSSGRYRIEKDSSTCFCCCSSRFAESEEGLQC
ncbi:mucolipin-3 [Conger conger]|uniref:mucolipin-3 n=1 Tax=Conger conger TaxID=82655 RepID=UPI002A5999D6|nr:mucolipin-3 [Conger conger]